MVCEREPEGRWGSRAETNGGDGHEERQLRKIGRNEALPDLDEGRGVNRIKRRAVGIVLTPGASNLGINSHVAPFHSAVSRTFTTPWMWCIGSYRDLST